jgi:hypothetical protein
VIRALAAILLLAPATVQATVFVRDDIITHPTPRHFSVCHEGTCTEVDTVGITPSQWRRVEAVFRPPARNAAEERHRIARAIALMEKIVGPYTHTAGDKPGDVAGLGEYGQMDCIDEATNTTTYLTMMARAGLLRFHNVEATSTRLPNLWTWPHTTAVIRDRATGIDYAVDSWFGANGDPPAILPLSVWKGGWRPDSK